MPLIAYTRKTFSPAHLAIIEQANAIIAEYEGQGFILTLRQLYYQFVARDVIPNRQSEYKRLGGIINDARLAGLIDWSSLEDRTRELKFVAHFDDPADIVDTAARQYRIDKWSDQRTRLEVWIEKDALVGVIDRVCKSLDVPYFSCRGYTSQSEMWAASQRFLSYVARRNQRIRIIHFGDHDPSGIDMSRDIEERIRLFMGRYGRDHFSFERIALNDDQIEQYGPPPNPVKLTDSRSAGYQRDYGDESWELDALEPRVIAELITEAVAKVRDEEVWAKRVDEENADRARLLTAARNWHAVAEYVETEFDLLTEEAEAADQDANEEEEETEDEAEDTGDIKPIGHCAFGWIREYEDDQLQPGRARCDEPIGWRGNARGTEVVHIIDGHATERDHEAHYSPSYRDGEGRLGDA